VAGVIYPPLVKLVTIQYLRAAAALAVVVFHATARAGYPMVVGAAGVDVFFVISGFIMWTVTERPTAPGAFLAHRLLRIVPLYWLATFAAAATAHPDLLRLTAALLFVPWRAPDGNVWPVLVQGWTLQYEMFFYLLFAAALFLPRRGQLVALSIALVALALLSRAAPIGSPLAKTYTDPILLEFLAGIWLADIWRAGKLPAAVGPVLLAVAVAGFAAAGVAGLDPHGWTRLLVWGLPAWLLVAGGLALEPKAPVSRVGLALGDGSYSIYLFHTLIAGVVWRLPLGLALIPIAIVASTIGGVLLFRFVEAPIMRRLRGKPVATTEPPAQAAAQRP
jgi:exopolysaccharide production protein ExoZ